MKVAEPQITKSTEFEAQVPPKLTEVNGFGTQIQAALAKIEEVGTQSDLRLRTEIGQVTTTIDIAI